MHWLQSLDHALFHFINSSLSNPFFDWLMPILSGRGVPWLLAVIIAVPSVILLGLARLRVCAMLMVLTVALGDPLIVGSIKDAVKRPRPFVVVKDARLFGQVGTGYVQPAPDGTLPPNADRHSFPSAHAANTFAVATIAFLFYRRSARCLFPLAAAVAFSRVYNGVHYPIDITVGAILGTGYALAFAVLLQKLWNLAGKKVFPAWHALLPNLLNPESPQSESPQSAIANRQSPIEWLRLGYIVIFAALIGRWIYLATGPLDLSGDEAYQWLWSKHLALSYYSKSPGIAYLQWTGTHLFGDTNFGVRFFSPIFAAILSLLVLRFMAREVGARAAFCLLLITFATPLLVAGSVVMTVDPPLVLCWMWAVIAGWRATQANGKTSDWLIVGLASGLGFLCKATAAYQLICWAVFFVLHPPARAHLKKAGPWLALLLFCVCTLPVVIWNAENGWVTALHIIGDGGFTGPKEDLTLLEQVAKSVNYFVEFASGELGMLNPVFLIGSLWAMIIAWHRRAEKPLWVFLGCMSAPVFLGHWLFSLHSRVQLNWIAASVPPMFCLMAAVWSESKLRFKPWLCIGLLLGITASVFMHSTDLIGKLAPSKLPGEIDPSHRARGWRETALTVEAERAAFDPNAFIIADHYSTTGEYSFYSPPARAAAKSATPLVYRLDLGGPIIDQFPFWDEYNYRKHRQGENALFVLHLDPYKLETGWVWKWLQGRPIGNRAMPSPTAIPEYVASQFESTTNLGLREIKLADGRVFQRVVLFGCYHLK